MQHNKSTQQIHCHTCTHSVLKPLFNGHGFQKHQQFTKPKTLNPRPKPETRLKVRPPTCRSFITTPCGCFLSEDSKFCNHKRGFPNRSHFIFPQQEELATSTVPSSSSVRPSGCKQNLSTFAWPADSSDTGIAIAQSSVTQPLLENCNLNKNQDEYLNGLFISQFDL